MDEIETSAVLADEGSGQPFEPVERVNSGGDPSFIIIADHASNRIPPAYGTLGLPETEFHRHIAWDIGVGDLVRHLSASLNAPAILASFSRLLIDPNRGPDDPTLVMKLSDGAVISGNRDVDEAEIARRKRDFYAPYHQAIADEIASARAAGLTPWILSVHSFTPVWRGNVRPFHVGVLWDKDPRLAEPLIDHLGREPGLVVGNNEPYTGRLSGDTMYQHGTLGGLPHALFEVRQDLIDTHHGAKEWAECLARIIGAVKADLGSPGVQHFGTFAD